MSMICPRLLGETVTDTLNVYICTGTWRMARRLVL